jgi:hypothetical protein
MYMSTTVSRRLFFVKLKGKLRLRKPRLPIDGDDQWIGSALKRTAQPDVSSWWMDWKAITLTSGVILMIVVGIYVLAQNVKSEDFTIGEAQTISSARPAEIQPPTVRYQGAVPGSDSSTVRVNGMAAAANSPLSTDDSFRAAFDGLHQRVLPKELSGECDIGANIIKDMNECFVRNGVHADQ